MASPCRNNTFRINLILCLQDSSNSCGVNTDNQDLANFFNNYIIVNALKQESALRKMINAFSKEELYNYLIDNCNPVIKNIPSKYIAEFIGISAEWLSKTKRKI